MSCFFVFVLFFMFIFLWPFIFKRHRWATLLQHSTRQIFDSVGSCTWVPLEEHQKYKSPMLHFHCHLYFWVHHSPSTRHLPPPPRLPGPIVQCRTKQWFLGPTVNINQQLHPNLNLVGNPLLTIPYQCAWTKWMFHQCHTHATSEHLWHCPKIEPTPRLDCGATAAVFEATNSNKTWFYSG